MSPQAPRFHSPPPPFSLSAFDGVLPLDKPSGPTSHDVVADVRRTFGLKKVGHGGTLDPQATGLLVLLLGKGTKMSSAFLGSDKTYEGVMHLGVATDSQDAQGAVIRQGDASGVTVEQVAAGMAKLTGDLYQTPPMVSAIKFEGVPLYKHARRGNVVEREPRLIHVYEFRILEAALPRVRFVVRCTKGTYVRTLCADVGDALGCGAHLAELRRTQCGDLSIGDALPLDAVLRMERDELARHILPLSRFIG
jgi:tRNA pseudouridine55 synthase